MLAQTQAILPIPLHPSRLRERGYNQAERFAKGLSEALEIPLAPNLLQRTRKTGYQAKKVGVERWENVKGAFRISKRLPAHLLLVDDVITTGATIGTCLESLYETEHPPTSVHILAIGMTRQQ